MTTFSGHCSSFFLFNLPEIMGSEQVFRLSQDDKARIPLGLTAANKQAPILMRYEADYRVTLPDHNFVIAPTHKLIPSIYAGLTFSDRGEVTYSGPTLIAIRSAKHDSSTAQSHCADFFHLVHMPAFSKLAKTAAGDLKPIVIITVDGGDFRSYFIHLFINYFSIQVY